ncbi:hypothetical protein SDJN02_26580 [Cucurbita argyrosperma subsp. argyrosperma]
MATHLQSSTKMALHAPVLLALRVFVSLVSKTSKDIDVAEAQQEGVENIGPDYIAGFIKMKCSIERVNWSIGSYSTRRIMLR